MVAEDAAPRRRTSTQVWEEYPLIGQYLFAVEDDGALVLPKKFQRLGTRIVAGPLDGCIGLWPEAAYATFAADTNARVPKRIARHFFAASSDLEVLAGRVELPSRLLTAAGIHRRGLVTGSFDRVEVWNLRRWRLASRSAASAQCDDETKERS
jgi:DNA-binding transcriptional regulator/RsmH inhibitor MraZ